MVDFEKFQTVSVRKARQIDFDDVALIWHQSASLPGVGPPIMPTLEELRGRIDNEVAVGWDLYVALIEGERVGILAIKPESRVLDQLFVRPGQLGAGIGRTLMDFAKQAMSQGFTLHTASTNERARNFYERTGMKLSREGVHPRTGHPVVWYEWTAGN